MNKSNNKLDQDNNRVRFDLTLDEIEEKVVASDNYHNVFKGILVKKSDDVFEGKHPNAIDEGYTFQGFFKEKPTVGLIFEMQSIQRWFHTSVVNEILSETENKILFTTNNSTYELTIKK